MVTHGVQAGDVQDDRAIVWARCSEPARMIVEWATTAAFTNPHKVAGPVVGPTTDYTGWVALLNLPAGQTITYRIRFEREADRGASAWALGRFQLPHPTKFRFVWTGDTCGQGYGRNPEWGGLLGYKALREASPAFFLNSGDLIYADNPILPEQRTLDGRVWRNLSNERVARVAQELDDFRARFAYNLEDEHVRALAAEVPVIAQWDDHETHNDWWPQQLLDDDRFTLERNASVLAARALRALREWVPIGGPTLHRVIHYGPLLDVIVVDLRSFRTPNDGNRGDTGAMLGARQAAWLVDALARSTARWKVVACDQPLAPFWEFVAGPIHAGTFGPNALDPTFGPELKFQWAPPPGTGNLAPWDGLQSFGTVDVTTDALHVALVGIDGKPRFAVDLPFA